MLEYLIPIVIISWPGSNVPPLIIQDVKVATLQECHKAQEQIMYNFTSEYPYFWNSTYTGMCIPEQEAI